MSLPELFLNGDSWRKQLTICKCERKTIIKVAWKLFFFATEHLYTSFHVEVLKSQQQDVKWSISKHMFIVNWNREISRFFLISEKQMHCNEVTSGTFYKKILYNLACTLFWLKYQGSTNCSLGISMIAVDRPKFL